MINLIFIFASLSSAFAQTSAHQEQSAADKLQLLYSRLAGRPLLMVDKRYPQALAAAHAGDFASIASMATDEDGFYNVTLRHFASSMSNRAQAITVPLNEFIMTIIGTARDNLDARLLLTGDYVYTLEGRQKAPVLVPKEEKHINLRQKIFKKEQQQIFGNQETAGLMTTYQWAQEHFQGGTNRRAVYFSFSEFLCTPLTDIRDTTIGDRWVRRDVPRNPGGNADLYQRDCRGCHSGMDALAGAFAYFDFRDGQYISELQEVSAKNNRNIHVAAFATNHVTDSSWQNLWKEGRGASLGWRSSKLRGQGVNSYGQMLANSQAFSRCISKRAYLELCREEAADVVTQQLASQFEEDGYNLRRLFENVALSKECLSI